MSVDIINIVDPRILQIPIEECHEDLINLKNQNEIMYGPVPESPLTQDDYTWLRVSVYKKLCLAQKQLPNNWYFRVYEGFRSKKVQQLLFDQQYQQVLRKDPGKSAEAIFYETTRLVSPVTNFDGSTNIPAHNTGAAVDIEIVMKDGRLVDMGMAAKDWLQVPPELCLTECPNLHKQARENRKILLDVMSSFDFVNYPTEWWHFSYGDRYWAYHKKKTTAIYGSVEDLLKFKYFLS